MRCPFCKSYGRGVKSRDDYTGEWPPTPTELATTWYCSPCRSFFGSPDGRAWKCTGERTEGRVGVIIYEPGREPKPEPDPSAGPSSRVRFLGGIS